MIAGWLLGGTKAPKVKTTFRRSFPRLLAVPWRPVSVMKFTMVLDGGPPCELSSTVAALRTAPTFSTMRDRGGQSMMPREAGRTLPYFTLSSSLFIAKLQRNL